MYSILTYFGSEHYILMSTHKSNKQKKRHQDMHNVCSRSIITRCLGGGQGAHCVVVGGVLVGWGYVCGCAEEKKIENMAADDTDIVDVSFSTSGCLSVLTRSGKWTAYRVSVSPSSTLSTLPLSPPVYLFSLSFLSSVSHASAHTSEISLLALTSSHVLLACITLANPEITLLLWDVQYGVILAEQQFACPLNLYRGKGRGVRMDLVASGSAAEPSQALLVLHPADAKSQESLFPRATSVLVVPLSVPRTSTIANALGRAAASQAYLRPEADSPQRVKGTQLTLELGGLEPEQGRTLKALLEVQEKGRTAEVEKRWAAYVEAGGPEGKPRLGHLFVKQLLDVLFLVPSPGRDVATTNATEAYARGVLTYLLERRAVSDAMIEGGLLPALMVRNDWSNAVLALSTVIDLPESDIISLLAKIVAHHRQSNTNPDAMQVDSPSPPFSTPPTLPAFLALCVTSPASPGPLRVALRKHLPDAEDVLCLIEVLDRWVGKWGEEELRLVPDRVKKDTHGMYVPIFEDERNPDMPPLDKILLFTQAVLDSSFVALLAHPPAHALLRTLLARLEPELALIAELQSLKGPLSAFASAQSRSAFLHGPGRAKGESQDWRQRKKAQTEQREMNIGMYQMEELVI
ncbi:hypothetical protein EVJ58_g1487 [Rhodofomes roseus]|uniref:Uncharacterized protein n=1 Tax=Rhodofomes roseus TaxID=34475 RepID=A0A4Y9YZ54_9APHY|nr:hypothetical protein EVJ58_g1487 [Rhodofomes roseus]